jgi:hypothetical protein
VKNIEKHVNNLLNTNNENHKKQGGTTIEHKKI